MGADRPMGETAKTPSSLGGRPVVTERPPSMWTKVKRRVTVRSPWGGRHPVGGRHAAAAATSATLV